MLPKNNRLKKRKDFGRILHGSRRKEEEFFILRVSKNNIDKVRFGISVSKKISKKATLRNKTRRRVSALLKEIMPRVKEGNDVFINALPGLEKKHFLEIKQVIEKNFEKAGILKNG